MSESTISQTARKVMKDAFRSFDTDKSGFIEPHELSMLLRKLTDSFHVMNPSDDEIIQVFREIDVNGDGKISKKQFDLLVDEIVKIIEQKRD